MAHYSLPSETSYNFSAGLDQYFLYLNNQIPNLFNGVLVFIFLLIFLGGYIGTKRNEGKNDIGLWMAVGGLITLMIALILNIIAGGELVPLSIEVIWLSVTIVGGIMYFITPNR